MAVKRREQALQDYRRLQAKVEKYEEKEKTGPVLAKLHQVSEGRGGRGGGEEGTGWLEVLLWQVPPFTWGPGHSYSPSLPDTCILYQQ